MVDYSWRGHCIEQSKLIEADTCQSKAWLRPDLIQDILLLLREITAPVALSLWEPACTNPFKGRRTAHIGIDLMLPLDNDLSDSIVVLHDDANAVENENVGCLKSAFL